MNSHQSLDCLAEKGIISDEDASQLQNLVASLPGRPKELWKMLFSGQLNAGGVTIFIETDEPWLTGEVSVIGGCIDGEEIQYSIYKNGVFVQDFTGSTFTIPYSFNEGDILTVKDSCGNISNEIEVHDILYTVPSLLDLRTHKGDKVAFGINAVEGNPNDEWAGVKGSVLQSDEPEQPLTKYKTDGTPYLDFDGVNDWMEAFFRGGQVTYTALFKLKTSPFANDYGSIIDSVNGVVGDRWGLFSPFGTFHPDPPPSEVRLEGVPYSHPFELGGGALSEWVVLTIKTNDSDASVLRGIGQLELNHFLNYEHIALFVYDGEPTLEQIEKVEAYHQTLKPIEEIDPDALDWITRTETADGQSLEQGVREAMNRLVLNLKASVAPIADYSWDALIEGTAIPLVGARTLAGALTPIHSSMPSPTNINFVQGDYSRILGLKGGTNKRIHSGLLNDSNPVNDNSSYMRVTEGCDRFAASTSLFRGGAVVEPNTRGVGHGGNAVDMGYYNNSAAPDLYPRISAAIAFYDVPGGFGVSRSDANITKRMARSLMMTDSISPSTTAAATELALFSNYNDTGRYTNARAVFYAAGRAFDLSSLDAIVTTYLQDITDALS